MKAESNNKKLQNMEIIWNLTDALHKSNNLYEILDNAFTQAMRATNSESATLWLSDEAGSYLYPHMVYGPNAHGLQGVKLKMGEGIAGWVAENREPQIVHDTQQDQRWSQRVDKTTGYVTHSILCVPLMTKLSTWGCLQFINKLSNTRFDLDDLALVIDMAALIAISLEKQGLSGQKEIDQKVLIRFENVCKTYLMGDVQVDALKEISLDIYEGELLVILGPSGSGKTTLLNLLGGMDRASSGQVWFQQRDLSKASDKELNSYRRYEIGFVFQFYNLISDLTAGENIEIVADLIAEPWGIDEVLTEVGLKHRKDSFPSQLSGGEQQRVSIARALVKKPRLLLCDEPTGALDDQTGKMILVLLETIARKTGGTVAIVTHNTAITPMADRILKMRNGQIVEIIRNYDPEPAKNLVF